MVSRNQTDIFMNAEGVNFVDPGKILRQIEVAAGATVADFGCGSGYFSFEFAKAVGPEGKVLALDILPSALEAVASRAKILNLGNVTPKRVNLEREGGSGLGPSSTDWVVLKDMLFQNEQKQVILEEVARVLKPGGQAIIMEWNPKASAVGPEKKLRIEPEALKSWLGAAGFVVTQEVPAGGYHYAFVVKKV